MLCCTKGCDLPVWLNGSTQGLTASGVHVAAGVKRAWPWARLGSSTAEVKAEDGQGVVGSSGRAELIGRVVMAVNESVVKSVDVEAGAERVEAWTSAEMNQEC